MSNRLLAGMFWTLNIGLGMMVFISLVPAGIYQAWASVSKGMWFARSPEVVHSHFMETMVWLRVPGDVVFAIGTVLLAWFALRLLRGARLPRARCRPRGFWRPPNGYLGPTNNFHRRKSAAKKQVFSRI